MERTGDGRDGVQVVRVTLAEKDGNRLWRVSASQTSIAVALDAYLSAITTRPGQVVGLASLDRTWRGSEAKRGLSSSVRGEKRDGCGGLEHVHDE